MFRMGGEPFQASTLTELSLREQDRGGNEQAGPGNGHGHGDRPAAGCRDEKMEGLRYDGREGLFPRKFAEVLERKTPSQPPPQGSCRRLRCATCSIFFSQFHNIRGPVEKYLIWESAMKYKYNAAKSPNQITHP